MNSPLLDYYPILDGFLYDSRLKCDMRFRSIALQEYEALRRSRGYAQRIVTVPEDAGHTVIPNRNVFRYAQRVLPGSAFWAYSFIAPAGQFSVQMRDNCSDETLFSEVLLGIPSKSSQIPLSKLLIIGSPGLIDFEICSLSGEDLPGVQFLLWGGEPKFRGGV